MPSIYLSKSNRSNPDTVMRVRDTLTRLFKGCRIEEFKGGVYDATPLLNSDVVIVIPPSDLKVNVGKGQYRQVLEYMNTANKAHVYLVSGMNDSGLIYLRTIIGVRIEDEMDWAERYGTLSVFGNRFSASGLARLVPEIRSHVTKIIADNKSRRSRNSVTDLDESVVSAVKVKSVKTGYNPKGGEVVPMLACISLFNK